MKMKYVVIPSNRQMIYDLIDKVDGYILGIDNYSVNLPYYFNLEEIIEITKYLNKNNKEVFIDINKNIHNEELPELKKILLELNNFNVKVMYYDISIVNLKNKLNLKYDLVWAQEHLTTNSHTINFWNTYGASYTLLSNELTKNEINNIKENTSSKLMYTVFGYIPIFTSKIHLVDNYLNTFDLKKNNNDFKLYKEGKFYKIIDDKLGTTLYNASIINAIGVLDELKIDYAILNSAFIETDKFYKVIDMLLNKTKLDTYNMINEFIESDTAFLFKEAVYKVK